MIDKTDVIHKILHTRTSGSKYYKLPNKCSACLYDISDEKLINRPNVASVVESVLEEAVISGVGLLIRKYPRIVHQ